MHFDHFQIRLITPEDAENYFQLVDTNRKRLEDYFSGTVARTKTLQDAREFLVELQVRTQSRLFFPYAIIDENTNQFVGYLHTMSFDWNIPKAEIGFFIDQHHTGKGIITKAVMTLMQYYFETLGFNKIFLRTHPTNTSSRAVAERCGFEIEGHIRKDYKTTKGELVDMLYYGKLRSK